MHYESTAALFFLVSFALLLTSVFHLSGSTLVNAFLAPLYQLITKETPPLPKRSSPSSELNVELLLARVCQHYGPVRFNTLDRKKAIKILIVLTTLSHLFEHLKYVGTIEPDEVLAYYLLLSELSFVKKRYPNALKRMLMKWPLPKGNLTLSLLISTGQIDKSTFDSLESYLPYISGKSARLEAVNYCLDACAEGSLYFGGSLECILISASEPRIVHKLKRILRPSALSSDRLNVAIAGCLLHFAPAELGEALVDDLSKALAVFANRVFTNFFRHPTTHRDSDLMLAIFERNVKEFQAIISFTDEQRTALSVINKIKFGAVQDIKNMSESERKELFDMLRNRNLELVFYIWAREDVEKYRAWEQFAKDSSNSSIPFRLAFDLEGFFENHFSADLFEGQNPVFCLLLEEFKYYPNCSKKKRFHELLRAKVQEGSETKSALSRAIENIECLINFFIDQGDKVGLKALNSFVYYQIDGALDRYEYNFPLLSNIIRSCQLFYGHVDGVDSLGLLAERFGAAKVLRRLGFSRLRANDVGEILSVLGISPEQMNAALSSLSHNDKPEDELAAMLWQFHKDDRDRRTLYDGTLLERHTLWFYLWKEHPEAFVEHVHPKIKQHYLPEESKLPEPVC